MHPAIIRHTADFDEDRDRPMLDPLLLLDEILAREGHIQYPVVIARRD